jgi:hypothetical protein
MGFFRNRAILTIRNDTIATINALILNKLLKIIKIYNTVDSIKFDIIKENIKKSNIL